MRDSLSGRDAVHPYAWLAWLVAAALPALSTRNPLYLLLTLLAVGAVYAALGRRSSLTQNWGAFVRFSAFLWLLTVPFILLLNHHGVIVLFRLPADWPLVGGPITLEALLYGLTGGLALVTLLLVFAAFNVAVDQARLLRLTPGFIYQAGVVAGIAVAFVPQMVAAWTAIREAQEVRGHRVRGVRDLLPLLLPLLITALERAMQLAESMEARGFGGQILAATPAERLRLQAALLAGLAALGVGMAGLGFWPEQPWRAGGALAGGAAFLLWAFWDQGRRVRRSRYRRWAWAPADRLLAAISLAAAGLWLGLLLVRPDWLFYYPYPPYSPWPTFEPLLGFVILLLIAPAFMLTSR
ncbi:MAG: energy-coupling factor transporter transmembrane component T [Anaerolineae bacterium]